MNEEDKKNQKPSVEDVVKQKDETEKVSEPTVSTKEYNDLLKRMELLEKNNEKLKAENEDYVKKQVEDEKQAIAIQKELEDEDGDETEIVRKLNKEVSELKEKANDVNKLKQWAKEVKLEKNKKSLIDKGVSVEKLNVLIDAFGEDALLDGRINNFIDKTGVTDETTTIDKPVETDGNIQTKSPNKVNTSQEELEKKASEYANSVMDRIKNE